MNRYCSVLIFLTLFGTISVNAQQLYNSQTQLQLKKVSGDIGKLQDQNYQKALDLAKKLGRPLSGMLKGRSFQLHSISETGELLYISPESNALAAGATKTTSLYNNGSLGLNLNGSSAVLSGRLGEWDEAAVLATHQEFGGRVSQQDGVTTTSLHSSHVAGTLIASGINSQAKGMAFGANLKAWDFANDNAEMATAASNLLISNHSYGFNAGWAYDDVNNRWQWWGNDKISVFEDYKFGFYDSNTQTWDKIAYNAPYYLIVKSAGNNRGETGPGDGQLYYLGTSNDTSRVVRSKNNGYDIISTTGTAKNILTVGAVNPLLQAPGQSSDISISDFSSFGPTDDGRIKPDIVGVGVNIFSTTNTSNTSYGVLSGTSMSSPQVAGSILLLQELYAKQNGNLFMRSATLKGLILHTAFDAGNPGPDYIYGWGLLDVEKAAKVMINDSKAHSLTERVLENGATYTQQVVASGKGPLIATISWTDPEAAITTATAANLNNRTPKLVNDLDIRVSDGTTTFQPWVLNPDKPADNATKGDNIRDNIEQIYIPNAVAGRTYTISINHKGTLKRETTTSGTLGNPIPQNYALVISGIGGTAYCSSTPTEKSGAIQSFSFGNINNTSTAKSDFTDLRASVSIGQKIPLDITLTGNSDKIVKVFIDWNSDGDFDDANENAATSNTISGTGKFSTVITAPAGLVVGNSSLMRVICQENPSNAQFTACGTYAKGETEEYSIIITRPADDVGVTNLTSPENAVFCSGTTQTNISVTLKNFGLNTQTNIPVTVKVSDPNGLVTTVSGTFNDSLVSLAEKSFTLAGTFNPVAGVNYSFEVSTGLLIDQDPTNNTKTFVRSVNNPVPPAALAVICGDGAVVNLTASAASSTPIWYDALKAGNIVATGLSATAPKKAIGEKYYVSVNDFSGNFGPKDKYAFGGGTYYEAFGPSPVFKTEIPLVLESARIYVGTPGKITFTVTRVSDQAIVSSITVDVKATRTTANQTKVSSQLIDDPTDQGVVIPLNLVIPSPGQYMISQECKNGATIYRSNRTLANPSAAVDNIGYPFTLANIVSISESNSSGSVVKSGYYYFYDMKLKSYGCPSPRAEVVITQGAAPTVSISPNGNVKVCDGQSVNLTATSSSTAATYQWLQNGTSISGATNATYQVKTGGSFSVLVKDSGLCSTTSQPVVVTLLSPLQPLVFFSGSLLSTQSGSNPQWFLENTPIPGANQLTYLPIASGNYKVQISDVNGCTAISDPFPVTITATEEEIVKGDLRVFPNPTQNSITVKCDSQSPLKNGLATIYSLSGAPIASQKLVAKNQAYEAEFDVSKLNSGTFVVRIVSENNVKVIPFVKQ
ncbi:Por secretion system C-terminal sorting domain-containing protein [Pseudarcicella hirudinis]|uniref:Por secretion system C-terminal sorting domain-containing protein n=1 Tax=Pseudarcicella hirudinis TaxID=1079859 RepID=A0A1I5XLT4_9BACT|nr:S8 family serine peptidase [Pseudarcicella hirudinis]SFQ32915.1 Por secretion system C-terminal sorting domain-containing protein [Pseudarcicella hirudinis]